MYVGRELSVVLSFVIFAVIATLGISLVAMALYTNHAWSILLFSTLVVVAALIPLFIVSLIYFIIQYRIYKKILSTRPTIPLTNLTTYNLYDRLVRGAIFFYIIMERILKYRLVETEVDGVRIQFPCEKRLLDTLRTGSQVSVKIAGRGRVAVLSIEHPQDIITTQHDNDSNDDNTVSL